MNKFPPLFSKGLDLLRLRILFVPLTLFPQNKEEPSNLSYGALLRGDFRHCDAV